MGDDPHPHDDVVLAQYPDPVVRQTYPPLPRTGGNPNARLETGAEAGVLNALSAYQRKRGIAPTDLSPPVVVPEEIAQEPDVEALRAAGWLG